MELQIEVYKDTGKYYSSHIVRCDCDIPFFDDRFVQFVKNNLPADIGEGYIVVTDTPRAEDSQSFHRRLYKYSELML